MFEHKHTYAYMPTPLQLFYFSNFLKMNYIDICKY